MNAVAGQVCLERRGRLGIVTLNRVARRNAFDLAMLSEFEDVVHELSRAADLDVVVLRGEGDVFCAGTDLNELSSLGPLETQRIQRRTGDVVQRWFSLEQTTLTAMNGPAIGSGAVLALASDLRLCTPRTYVRFPEVAHSIPLTWSGVAILADLVGADLVKRWLLLGSSVTSDGMRDLGLVLDVVEEADLSARTDDLAQAMLATPGVVRAMVQHTTRLAGPRFEATAGDSFLGSLGVALRQEPVAGTR